MQTSVLALAVLAAASQWPSPVPMPEGSRRYAASRETQVIYVTSDYDVGGRLTYHGDVIERVKAKDPKWLQAGGLEGVGGWIGIKYRLVPGAAKYSLAPVSVENSFKQRQDNTALVRSYPEGTRFDELLVRHDGRLFEHRTRVKGPRGWRSFVSHRDPRAYPEGYGGLKVSCSSCHDEAGTGKYAEGLVPGGDGVISDPMDWGVARRGPLRFLDKTNE